jgi:crotonobetainyl-CoA:carnitine CoA-transferase CaiB-like acyl-CoA transferase
MFDNLKVVELASVLAGPAVGTFFSELGAQVIKIENKKTSGDVTRSWKLPQENPDHKTSAYFSSVNYKKKYLLLDYTLAADYAVTLDYLTNADIIITNFKTGDDVKFKLDYHTIRNINPTVIYGSITGFGHSKRTAFDVVLQAESGFMSMNGTRDSGPVKMPVALIDILAAHQLKEAILLALLKKEKTGKGSYVNVSLYNSALASLANQASNYLMAGHIAQPIGSLHPNIAPYGEMFYCSDNKPLVLAVGNNKQFESLCKVLNCENIIQDIRFKNNPDRVANRKELAEILALKIKLHPRNYWMQNFEENQIPAGAVYNLQEVFEKPEAKAMIREEIIDGELTKRVSSIAFNTSFIYDRD